MARQQPRDLRKRRTRAHVIADLSVNHVERFVLLRGHVAERTYYDYGVDLRIFTFDSSGAIENGWVFAQLKATDDLAAHLIHNGATISFPIDRRDLLYWSLEVFPVLLIVYDAATANAWWLNVQQYLRETGFDFTKQLPAVTHIHLPMTNRLNEAAIDRFAEFKRRVQSRFANPPDTHA